MQGSIGIIRGLRQLVKREYCHEVNDDELRKDVHDKCYAKAYAVATSGSGKHERSEAFEKIVEEYKAQFSEEELTDEKLEMIGRYYHDVEKEAMRRAILDEGKRLDGRKIPRSVRSGSRQIACRVLTVPLSLHVERHSLYLR